MEIFEKAQINQLNKIIKIYHSCKQDLLQRNILQWGKWGNNYPGNNIIKDAIDKEELFILIIDNKIVGSVILNEIQSKEWDKINWCNTNGRALIIHALVIDPNYQNKGLGKKLLLLCEQYARENKYTCIRLDSFIKNDISNMLYQKHGYKNVGIAIFYSKPDNNKEYFCYEKFI